VVVVTETDLVVEPLRRQSVVHLAIEQIRRMISTGALSPGQRLPAERELAELFGVSRPTIREAIRVLGFSGVIETKQGSGSYVAIEAPADLSPGLPIDVTSDAYDDVMEVRLWLEVGACEAAATKVSKKQLAKLRSLMETFLDGPREPERFVTQEMGFHGVIHEASGNDVLLSQMRTMRKLIEDRLRIAVETFGVRQASLDEHWEILAALEARDPIEARRTMRKHLTVARDELRRQLETWQDDGAQ
jgi:GntR family transcriptional repressor for pyruvate dehydrogenase complex